MAMRYKGGFLKSSQGMSVRLARKSNAMWPKMGSVIPKKK
jgi:hypothetical protein